MKRAAILIGVHEARELTKLHAVKDGVRRMEAWARAQEFDAIRPITDEGEGNEVSSGVVAVTVADILEQHRLDQLVIYFTGHGVNLSYNEYWLLNRAVQLPNESINVAGSRARARHCGVKHVVFISDACRTAPNSLREQGTTGTIIFPNAPPGESMGQVDIFYATRLGEPAHEVREAGQPAAEFRAIFTDSLLDALNGRYEEICTFDDRQQTKVVRPWPLRRFLCEDVPKRFYELTNAFDDTQVPEAEICSDPDEAWISNVALARPDMLSSFSASTASRDFSDSVRTELDQTAKVIRTAIEGYDDNALLGGGGTQSGLESVGQPDSVTDLLAASRRYAETFGPEDFASQCGFKVRGARVVEVISQQDGEISGDGLSVEMRLDGRPCSVLLVFESGRGAVLPALPEFIGSLTIDNQHFTDLYFEPAQGSHRWYDYSARRSELRQLRGVVAAATRRGVFQLRGNDAETLARRMQFAKSIDPSLALYAAHTYASHGKDVRLQEMLGYLRSDLERVPLDIALLAGQLRDTNTAEEDWIVPFLPMLAQSWALLPAYNVELPPSLVDVQRHIINGSLWSQFEPAGVTLIREAIQTGELS